MYETMPTMNASLTGEVCESIIDVPHLEQKHSWDCGLACLTMVLKYLGKDTTEVYTTDVEYLQCGEDVWTIDLAYLMERHGVQHHMCTVTLGIHDDYRNNAYYSDTYDSSAVRINRMFDEAETKGVSVEKRSVLIEEIIEHLKANLLVVCLVDAMQLECRWCDNIRKPSFCCFQICSKHFEGHFVVVCGYDCDKKLIYYKNPGIYQELCCSRWEEFDRARKSFGTDEDIIFINEEYVENTGNVGRY